MPDTQKMFSIRELDELLYNAIQDNKLELQIGMDPKSPLAVYATGKNLRQVRGNNVTDEEYEALKEADFKISKPRFLIFTHYGRDNLDTDGLLQDGRVSWHFEVSVDKEPRMVVNPALRAYGCGTTTLAENSFLYPKEYNRDIKGNIDINSECIFVAIEDNGKMQDESEHYPEKQVQSIIALRYAIQKVYGIKDPNVYFMSTMNIKFVFSINPEGIIKLEEAGGITGPKSACKNANINYEELLKNQAPVERDDQVTQHAKNLVKVGYSKAFPPGTPDYDAARLDVCKIFRSGEFNKSEWDNSVKQNVISPTLCPQLTQGEYSLVEKMAEFLKVEVSGAEVVIPDFPA